MDEDATVSAADIARLAGVGRAAVSNCRRRHPDFPQPVGGTASIPLFGLADVAKWFRARGKKFELSAGERAWQRLRALGDDLDLAGRVSRAGGFFAFPAANGLMVANGMVFLRAETTSGAQVLVALGL